MGKYTEATIFDICRLAKIFMENQNIELSDENILETMKIVSLAIINLSLNDIRENLKNIEFEMAKDY